MADVDVSITPWADTGGLRVHETDGDIPKSTLAGGEDPRVTGVDDEDPRSPLEELDNPRLPCAQVETSTVFLPCEERQVPPASCKDKECLELT